MWDFTDMISLLTEGIGASLVLCSFLEIIEIVDLAFNWHRTGGQKTTRHSLAAGDHQPFVSLHVPLCSEPVAVVESTLNAIAALEYTQFEAVIVYNNTSDPRLWEPIAHLCTKLGSRFKFHFVRELPGYKAGALNFALRHTAPNADIIGVIDADYIVEPDYLISIVPFFLDEQIAFVQSPQDYRAPSRSWFLESCYWEYWQFFEIGMTLRSLRNATMLHGTMSLVRKQALLQTGGWAEWCVTEDSELGLRLLMQGYQSLYVKSSYGHGLLPFSFGDYKRQRWRWVAGGAQQFRRHLQQLTIGNQLSIAQKAHHFQGWLPWLRDALVATSLPFLGLVAIPFFEAPESSLFPLIALGIGVGSVVFHQIARHVIIYRMRLNLPWSHTVLASLAVLSLTCTIGPAWILALFGRRTPFKVTPKAPNSNGYWWQDLTLELASGAYVILIALHLLFVQGGARWTAALIPALYLLLIAPAYAMSFVSRLPPRASGLRTQKPE